MPYVEITNINTIRANLNILASFDGCRGLDSFGARKLQINAATGAFSTKDGLYRNIFQRSGQDSLLHADTIRTIRTMFTNAINYMTTYTGADKQRDETRKLIFRGYRGLAYLAYNGYRTRNEYQDLQNMIKSINDDLDRPLRRIIIIGLTNNLWFDTGVQVRKAASFSQSDFLDDPMGGICYGICMDWCRRVLVKNKFSFTTSSKQNEWDQIMQEVETFQMNRIRDDITRITNNVIQDPSFTTHEARIAEIDRQGLPLASISNEILKANRIGIQNMRYRKKGNYQALAQQNQHEKVNISDKISMLQLYKLECESKINDTYTITVQDGDTTFYIPQYFPENEKAEFRKAVIQINNAVGEIGRDFPLTKAAQKFSRMEYHITDELVIPNGTVLCMSDPSDFQIHLAPLINRCINSMDGVTPKAFYLSFAYSGNYAGIDKSGGHAMAFSKNPATNVFYAIDPNVGEFSSQTLDGLTFIFCVLLSHYSLSRNMTKFKTATVSLRDVP